MPLPLGNQYQESGWGAIEPQSNLRPAKHLWHQHPRVEHPTAPLTHFPNPRPRSGGGR